MKYFLLLLLILFASFSCKNKTSPDQYSMFRGDARHTAIYSTVDIKQNPTLKWKFKTDGFVNGSAAMLGDQLYFGSGDGNMYCVNAPDGSLAWKFHTGGPVFSTPAIDDGTVFFGSHDGIFYALNGKDGKMKWSFKTKGEKRYSAKGIHGWLPKDSLFVDLWDFWLSSPVIDGDNIYFGSGDGYFYALDKNDGKLVWKFKTPGIIHSSPAIAFGNVYFGGWDTYIHALDASSGKEIWKYKTGDDTDIYNQTGITSSPIVDSDMLYIGCRDSNLYALDAKTGKLVWKKFNDKGWLSVTPTIFKEKVIYTSGSSQRFMELNKRTGDSIFQGKTYAFFSSPAVVGNTLVAGSFDGFMEARDINSGNILWSYQLPTSAKDTFHILNPDRSVNDSNFQAALDQFHGAKHPLEIRLSLGGIVSSPIVKDGAIYFGSTDGYFYALQ